MQLRVTNVTKGSGNMSGFRELYQPLHTLIGAGAIREIPAYVKSFHCKKALVVSDEGLLKAGTVGKVVEILEDAGMEYAIFTEVKPNPTTAIVEKGLDAAVRNQCDYVIGIGGGSPLDVAKAVAVLATNGGDVRDYEGVNKSKEKGLPIIAVNTTAGTGSEVTRDYVITDEEKKIKMLMVDNNCIASLAIDDPRLMTGMPPRLTAATGMDALTHAIEAYVCRSHFPYTDGLALEAVKLVAGAMRRAVRDGNDLEARTDMCWAEYMAGLAFSNAGLGMVHAMAHQLGGFYNIPHGVANAILLPYVMEYNVSECQERYAEIARALGVKTVDMTCRQAAQEAIRYIRELAEEIDIPTLKSQGFKPQDAMTLAVNAMNDTCMPDNPKDASVMDVKNVFMDAYEESF